jgi:hypothetical protein
VFPRFCRSAVSFHVFPSPNCLRPNVSEDYYWKEGGAQRAAVLTAELGNRLLDWLLATTG